MANARFMQVFTAGILGLTLGACLQAVHDNHAIQAARLDEMQANGLEDECKATINQNGSQNIAGVAGSVTSTTQSGLVITATFTGLPHGGWKLEHVTMPVCPDGLKRTVDAPEQDEVDALTVNCGVQP